MIFFQTGDLLYFQEPKLPKGLLAQKTNVLLKSDTTGHAHVVKNGKVYKSKDGVMYIGVARTAVLKHEEHKDLTLPKGNYRVQIVREFDHLMEEARNVID